MGISKKRAIPVRLLWPLLIVLVAAILVLFPFDWLGAIWPAYGQLFDIVFATALAHHIGHITIFLLASIFILYAFPTLLARPFLYFIIMVVGALSEEALQAISKFHLPTWGDGRDLVRHEVGEDAADESILWVWRVWLLVEPKALEGGRRASCGRRPVDRGACRGEMNRDIPDRVRGGGDIRARSNDLERVADNEQTRR